MSPPVSQGLVTQVWQEMALMPEGAAPELIAQLQDEQPALLTYLLALEGYDLLHAEFEGIFYLGMAVWQMIKRGHARLRRVLLNKLEQVEAQNT